MKVVSAVLLLMTSLLATMAQAEVQKATGKVNQMVELCSEAQDEFAVAACQGFLVGVVDTTRQYAATKAMTSPFCVPRDTSIDELVLVYREYLSQSRARNYFPATALAISAFVERYPCQHQDKAS